MSLTCPTMKIILPHTRGKMAKVGSLISKNYFVFTIYFYINYYYLNRRNIYACMSSVVSRLLILIKNIKISDLVLTSSTCPMFPYIPDIQKIKFFYLLNSISKGIIISVERSYGSTHSAFIRIGSKLKTDSVLNDETSEIGRGLCAFGPIGGECPSSYLIALERLFSRCSYPPDGVIPDLLATSGFQNK